MPSSLANQALDALRGPVCASLDDCLTRLAGASLSPYRKIVLSRRAGMSCDLHIFADGSGFCAAQGPAEYAIWPLEIDTRETRAGQMLAPGDMSRDAPPAEFARHLFNEWGDPPAGVLDMLGLCERKIDWDVIDEEMKPFKVLISLVAPQIDRVPIRPDKRAAMPRKHRDELNRTYASTATLGSSARFLSGRAHMSLGRAPNADPLDDAPRDTLLDLGFEILDRIDIQSWLYLDLDSPGPWISDKALTAEIRSLEVKPIRSAHERRKRETWLRRTLPAITPEDLQARFARVLEKYT